MNIRTAIAAASLATMLPLAACTKVAEGEAAPSESVDRTLAAAIADAPGLTRVASALSDVGLAGVFDGPGSYTVLAPDDEAFEKLGSAGAEIASGDEKALLVAILRDHVLPGHLTAEAIREAVTRNGGPVEVRTLGEGTVSFSIDGDTISVSGDDGLTAQIDGAGMAASNGVVLPIDGLLKKPRPIV